jgi:NADH dehydrogenase
MPKRIFLTGAAGFVGSSVVAELLARGYEITALLHRGELKAGADRVRIVRGDLFSTAALDEGLAGCDAVIHLVGIIRENPKTGVTFERIHFQGAKNVMDAAVRAGVKRFIHMSALGARQGAVAMYHQTKYLAEVTLRAGPLDATILRPSLIHGPGGDFLEMEAAWARGTRPPYLFMPYFGGGLLGLRRPLSAVQPVYVKDVARAFVDAIDNPKTIGQTYGLCGKERLSWPQMHYIAAAIFAGKPKPAVAIPAWYAKALTHVVPASLLPFTRDQVIMGTEDSACDMGPFVTDFGWEPGGFEETVKDYAGLSR